MKKLFLAIVLLSITLLPLPCHGWSPLSALPAFKDLQTDVTKQLNELFDREVTVESISGSLVNSVELKNVAIARYKYIKDGSVIKAPKIVISYNPIILAGSGGNIVKAISKIEIFDPEIICERDINGKWLLEDLVPKKRSGKKEEPFSLNATITIKGGYGKYIDHMGWGEPLNGKPFISDAKNLSGTIKVAGTRIIVNMLATSVIGRSIANANVTGNVNTKNGKYNFIINARNVDISKWASYTMNVPDFKPLSGLSDMRLSLTNPLPRKKGQRAGQPILFDGKFYIRDGKARIFGYPIDNMVGMIRIYDEEVTFTRLSGTKDGLLLYGDGRLYDFMIANYDIVISVPKTDWKKCVTAIPQIKDIAYKGSITGNVHVGGTYAEPKFNSVFDITGIAYGTSVAGKIAVQTDGTLIKLSSNDLKAFKGKAALFGVVDLMQKIPAMNINLSAEGFSVSEYIPELQIKDKLRLDLNIKGNLEALNISSTIRTNNAATFEVVGYTTNNDLKLSMTGQGVELTSKILKAKVSSFSGQLSMFMGDKNKFDPVAEASFVLSPMTLAGQQFADLSASILYDKNGLSIKQLKAHEGKSTINIGASVEGSTTKLHLTAFNAEAFDLKGFAKYLPKELLPIYGTTDLSVTIEVDQRDLDISKANLYGEIALKNGSVNNEKIELAIINIKTEGRSLNVKIDPLKGDNTNVVLEYSNVAGKATDLKIKGKLDLSILKPFTIKYGRLFGISDIDLHVSGRTELPSFEAVFNINKFRYNEIIMDNISGNMQFDGNLLKLRDPLKFILSDDEYDLTGKVSLYKTLEMDLRLTVEKGDLQTLSTLLDEINTEIASKQLFMAIGPQKNIVVVPAKFKFPLARPPLIYLSEGDRTHIDEIIKAETDSLTYQQANKQSSKKTLKGKLSGYINISGQMADPSGQVFLRVSQGTYESFTFDEALISGKLNTGTFEVDSLYLKKGDGKLSLSGQVNMKNSVSLYIEADKMPIDLISLFIGAGKNFDGSFDMKARIWGNTLSPQASLLLSAEAINIAGVPMNKMNALFTYEKGYLNIKKLKVLSDSGYAWISGTIPASDEALNMNITLEGDCLGLLTLASKDINWLGGKGNGTVSISGTTLHPIFNGTLTLNDAKINISPMRSNVESVNSKLLIKNNSISTSNFNAVWVGNWTNNERNKINLSGSIGWDKLFDTDRSLAVNLKLSNNDFMLNIPGIYKGDLAVKDVSINGAMALNKKGPMPKLSGSYYIDNGVILLPDMSKISENPPLELDMELAIGKNTYVVAGDVNSLISTNLSNVMLNLEITSDSLKISGNINEPIITGKTAFKQGSINILTREFSLMNEDRQNTLFGANLDRVRANEAIFSGGSLPNVYLSSEIKVRSVEKISAATSTDPAVYETKNVIVVSKITGIPYAKEKESGIDLTFFSYVEDNTKSPAELMPGVYDQQEIKVLLLPDYIKGSLGISERGVNEVNANEIVADYLNSRLNSYLLRNVERNVAKQLDLESLTLEYNFGRDIKNMLPSSQTTPPLTGPGAGAPETMYGIGAVKGFFDRFYIDVKYSQAAQEQTVINKTFFNYQLTYKLTPIVSVVYYREPYSFIEEQSDYFKVTLKAGYQL